MTRRLKKRPEPDVQDAPGMKCPNCGSTDIAGLMAAFWVGLTDGVFAGNFGDHCADTEVGTERKCCSCEEEFELE
jgi:hypothetical protein